MAVIIPFMHTVIAAILAIPLRANVAIAALFTLVVNPLTIPPMYNAAYRIGSWELHHDANLVNPATAERFSGELGRMLFWIHMRPGRSRSAILTIAVTAAAVGYLAGGAGVALVARKQVARTAPRPRGRGFVIAAVRGLQRPNARSSIGWAQVWRRNYREANLRARLLTDPHGPSAQ